MTITFFLFYQSTFFFVFLFLNITGSRSATQYTCSTFLVHIHVYGLYISSQSTSLIDNLYSSTHWHLRFIFAGLYGCPCVFIAYWTPLEHCSSFSAKPPHRADIFACRGTCVYYGCCWVYGIDGVVRILMMYVDIRIVTKLPSNNLFIFIFFLISP